MTERGGGDFYCVSYPVVIFVFQSQKKFALSSGPASLMKSSACLGAEVLMKLLGNYCRNIDVKTSITVGVVGEYDG